MVGAVESSRSLPWFAAVLRAFLPQRWGISILTLGFALYGIYLLSVLFPGVPRSEPLVVLTQPLTLVEQWRQWADQAGFLRVVLMLFLLLGVLGPVASVSAGVIARDEFVRWLPEFTPRPSVLRFLVRRGGQLILLPWLGCAFLGLLLFIPMVTSLLLWLPFGSLMVALLVPILWMMIVIMVLMWLGIVSFVLHPVAIAAEGTDLWDAFSRGYNYFYQRPIRFVILELAALGVAIFPIYGLSRWLELNPNSLSEHGQAMITLIVVGLGLSLFWSLQPIVYVVLRYAVDNVSMVTVSAEDVGQVNPTPKPDAAQLANTTPSQITQQSFPARLRRCLISLIVVVVTWTVMGRLMTLLSGSRADWLRWELYPFSRPVVTGIDVFASWLAGFWLFLGVLVGFHPLRGKPPTETKSAVS